MRTKQVAKALLVVGVMSAAGGASAAGFQLFETSGSALGLANSAGAAVQDASTIFWNPAGMTYLPGKNLSAALHLIKPKAEFNKTSATVAGPVATGTALTGGNGGDAGELAAVPNFYYSHEINSNLMIGIGLFAPFGLTTEYDDTWVGRYQAIKSDLRTVALNPSIGFRISPSVSIGGGVTLLRADAELTNKINVGILPPINTSQAFDVTAKVEGDDWGYGFNVGAMFQVNPSTRIGVAYRSKIKIELEGDATFTPNAGPFTNTTAIAKTDLPEMFSLSAYKELSSTWSIMGDISWTRWSRFKELRVDFGNLLPDSVTPENWDDTIKVAVGAEFRPGGVWIFRGGLAYDEAAAPDAFRTPRIPDDKRIWLAIGANRQINPTTSIDISFAHLFVGDAPLDKISDEADPRLRTRLIGDYDSDVNILSVQLNKKF